MTPSDEHDPTRSVPRWLLLTGVLAGIALAAFGLYEIDAPRSLSDEAIATVNGRVIAVEDYRQLLLALQQDRRDPLDERDREWILQRMIEEELLVQRALEIGLLESDPALRQAAVRAMLDTITADAASVEPSEEELRTFFERERERFAVQPRYLVRRLRFAGTGEASRVRAESARVALAAGASFERLRAQADRDLAAPPEMPLPPAKLVEHLGPGALERVVALEPGEVTEVLESGGDLFVLQLVAREPAPEVELESLREEVAAEWRRQRADARFRDYLEDLRRRASVERRESLP